MILICIVVAFIAFDLILRKKLKVKNKGFIGKFEHHNKNYATIEKYALTLFFLVVLRYKK